jgi:hypothetical protein
MVAGKNGGSGSSRNRFNELAPGSEVEKFHFRPAASFPVSRRNGMKVINGAVVA